jgi:hypothetical protein
MQLQLLPNSTLLELMSLNGCSYKEADTGWSSGVESAKEEAALAQA